MIYVDNAATSFPKAPGVAEAMAHYLTEIGASPGRSGHRPSVEAARIIFDAREQLAALLGMADSSRLVFTSGATFGINAALAGLLRPGDEVVTTGTEHNAVMRPLRHLESERGVRIRVAQGDAAGFVDAGAIADLVTDGTRLVVMTHASNVTGTILPIEAASSAIGSVPLLIDGAQTTGSVPIDLSRLGPHLFAFSGHKGLLGPPGIGGLSIGEGIDLPPLVRGGTGSRSEFEEQPAFLPDRLEGGTPNTVGIAGLLAAVRYVSERGVESVRDHERALVSRLIAGLSALEGVRWYGTEEIERRLATVSITIDGLSPSDAAQTLDRNYEIFVRPGLHCAPAAHRTIGTFPAGTIRISLGAFNTDVDVDAVLEAVADLARKA
jgi:cysteine desulfurase/selenocysteine lyase